MVAVGLHQACNAHYQPDKRTST